MKHNRSTQKFGMPLAGMFFVLLMLNALAYR